MAEEACRQFDAYDWEGDQAFKTGVQKVLDLKNVSSDASEAQPLIYKYKFFYFSKRASPLDPQTYEEWKNRESQSSESTMAEQEPDELPDTSRPWFQQKPKREIPEITPSEEKSASFDEIIQLITTGQPVPGIRQIPDHLSPEPPSTSSSAAPPKKPWEK